MAKLKRRGGIGSIRKKLHTLEMEKMEELRAAQAKLIAPLQRQYDKHQREAARIGAIIASVLGSAPKPKLAKGNAAVRTAIKRRKRVRRSPAQLKSAADAIVQFVKSKGKEGAIGREIKSRFGALLPSVKVWVEKYGGVKLKTEGDRSKMKYFA